MKFSSLLSSDSNSAISLVQIGAGGIGGYLCPLIARMCRSYSNIKYSIVDHDVVMYNNLDRQNFSMKDLGDFKAKVLAERYSALFGIPISWVNNKVDEKFSLIISKNLTYVPIVVVTCVDNHKTRYIVENLFRSNTGALVWIDIANDITNGQVFISRVCALHLSDVHKEVASSDSQGSCALDNRQLFQTNVMASIVGFNVLYDVLFNGHDYYEVVFSINNVCRKKFYDRREVNYYGGKGNKGSVKGDSNTESGIDG